MYHNIGTCRFYCNVLEFLRKSKLFTTTNTSIHTLPVKYSQGYFNIATESIYDMMSTGQHFLACLNYPANGYFSVTGADLETIPGTSDSDGFRIATFTETLDTLTMEAQGGSIILGSYYDMEKNADLSLSISREYGGTTETKTQNGSYTSNTLWNAPPLWRDLSQWSIRNDKKDFINYATGKRVWSLKFSYLTSSNFWGANQLLSSFSGTNTNLNSSNNNDFFTKVWHRTLGGKLPFIFQPDNSNNNPDQFAICTFKDDSLKVRQSAHNVYDVSLIIEETWA